MRASRCSFAVLTAIALLQPIHLAPAQTPAAPPSPAAAFDAATIKPVKEPDPNHMRDHTEGRRFTTHNTTLRDLPMMAYQLDPRQIAGGPAWVATDEYDIDAVAIDDAQLSQHREEMLRKLLADRFNLAFHREPREMSIYALTVANGGPRLQPGDSNGPPRSGCQHLGACSFRNDPIDHFARWLQFAVLDRPVINKTGISGVFTFTLTWTPDESQFTALGIHVPPPVDNPSAPPGLFSAIQEQLGLRLESRKIPAEVLIIDHVERPSEN